jgi:hypothetical protein
MKSWLASMYEPNSCTAFKTFLFVRRILFDRFEIVLEVFNPLEGSVHVSVPKIPFQWTMALKGPHPSG